ncbi:acyltransferase [Vibrio fluvialis]|uniref:acyltransferase n=1 Tax=Vibrio fluvialis TaxID=676 RepID=UPI003D7D1340
MNKILSAELMRFVAIVAVVGIHTTPFRLESSDGSIYYKILDLTFNQIGRFAVPMFFLLSGYFFYRKTQDRGQMDNKVLQSVKKLIKIYIIWSFVYLLPYEWYKFNYINLNEYISSVQVKIFELLSDPITLVFQGTKEHLWFIVALLFSFIISYLFIRYDKKRELIVVSILLYIFGVISKAYSATPIGIDVDFNTRNGPFFSTIFFVTGYVLAHKKRKPSWFHLGLIIFSLGTVFHFIEIIGLWKIYDISMRQDFVFSTYFMGLGSGLIALSNHKLLSYKFNIYLGSKVLGIYLVHYIVVEIFKPIDKIVNVALWEVFYIVMVICLSMVIVNILNKNSITRNVF